MMKGHLGSRVRQACELCTSVLDVCRLVQPYPHLFTKFWEDSCLRLYKETSAKVSIKSAEYEAEEVLNKDKSFNDLGCVRADQTHYSTTKR